MRISSLNIKKFNKEGFIIIPKLVKKKSCSLLIKRLNEFKNYKNALKNKDAVFEKKKIKYFKNVNFYINDFNILFSESILSISSKLIKDRTYYLNMGLHNKIPGKLETPPHQDNFYWCRKPNNALTAYVALNKQNKKTGAIGYLLKSHKGKTYPHKKSTVKAFSSYIDFKDKKKKNYFFPKLNPGDVIFHHCNSVHVSSQNNSKNYERKSVAITIYGENTKLDLGMKKKYLKNSK